MQHFRGEWPSGLKHFKLIGWFMVQTPLGSQHIRTQPHHDAPTQFSLAKT